jgi:hypothetical protein
MQESQIYREQITTLSEQIKAEFAGMDTDLLYKRPGPSVNNAGFLYWHILRIWDLDLNHIAKGEEPSSDAWNRGGYAARSDYDPTYKGLDRLPGMGLGYSDAEVDEVNVPLNELTAYHDQLISETNEYLESASDELLRAEIPMPSRPGAPASAAQRFQHLIGHSYGHVGDIRFIKGLLGYTDATYPKDMAKVAP